MADRLDAIVIGAGPAGLTSAIYLARFRRQVLVLHDGDSRAAWIPRSHNHPGFPGGIVGTDLLDRIRRQAEEFGAAIEDGQVTGLAVDAEGFQVATSQRVLTARSVILATGVIDRLPELPGVEAAVRRSLVRICPICDGFEVTGQAVAVIGDSALGAREALFLRTYSNDVTLIHTGGAVALPADERSKLASRGVRLIQAPIDEVVLDNDRLTALASTDHGRLQFDAVYTALGVDPRTDLADQAGARRCDDGRLIVDEHQQTTVAGLYAAGDLVRGLNQISTAQGEAAIAATALHNRLRETE
ncbi:NAD(P)/FAD-dependent oxidoreductase [soil metagenome]